MNWMAKVRPGSPATTPAKTPTAAAAAAPSRATVKPGPTASPSTAPAANVRISNALKEFLWLLSDVPRAKILDLGPAWQSTITFFIEKGYRVASEDMLHEWKDFLTIEEERLRTAPIGEETERRSLSALAEKFIETSLTYPEESVHGVLLWDLLDYFDPAVVPALMDRLYNMLHPGGTVLAHFHSRPAERFHRYRIMDGQTVELVPAPTLAVHAHVFQNREILDLFGKFRSSKTFVGRDQVREALFIK
ncbi:MAG TPA: class I SAM-dependent methyltransferase [Candidatus Acidoferrales bacterium]|nr:class I SAM-dependent methyltransferase [Candidatus Acidoferrales bacterium]